jgi:gliding motility-associated-like protein
LNDINKIDELLKQSFEGFSPQPPAGIWQGISNQLTVNQPPVNADVAQTIVNTTVKVKTFTVATKAIITAVAVATTGAAVWLVQTNQNSNDAAARQPEVTEAPQPTLNVEQTETIPSILVEPTLANTVENRPTLTDNGKKVDEQLPVTIVSPPKTIELNITELQQNVNAVKEKNNTNPEPNLTIKNLADEGSKKDESTQETFLLDNPEEPGLTEEILFTNVITPNNDGLNDFFDFIKFKNADFIRLTIINKRHETVFESEDEKNRWDGKHYKTGLDCPDGLYQFVFQYKTVGQTEIKYKLGTVKILK